MIKVLGFALGVAAVNVCVWRGLIRRALARGDFWRLQMLGFLFRLGTIFGGATMVWALRGRMPEVVMFIVVGAVAQMIGQVYFLGQKTPYA